MKLSGCYKIAFFSGLVAIAAVVAQPALADGKQGYEGGQRRFMMMHGFDRMDADHDGFISKKEMNDRFNKADADHDGRMSKTEWKKHVQKIHGESVKKRMQQCKPGMMGRGGSGPDYSGLNE